MIPVLLQEVEILEVVSRLPELIGQTDGTKVEEHRGAKVSNRIRMRIWKSKESRE